MLSFGFSINESDKCIYSKFVHEKRMIICLYVNDMLSFETDSEKVQKTKGFLSSKFSTKDMGEVNVILGIKIIRDNDGMLNSISLH